MEGGEGRFPEEKWPFAASRLSGAIRRMGRLDIFLPPLPLHLHLQPRLFAEVNASECRCPREPPRARETPTASHILRMKTFTTILARATPPTPSFPSRGQRPMMSLFLRVPAPSFLSSLFLPYPSLTLFEVILSSFLFSFFFFLFSFSNERVGRIEVCSLSSEKEERNFRYRRVWNGSKRTIVISFMLIREGYTILSFRLVLLEF